MCKTKTFRLHTDFNSTLLMSFNPHLPPPCFLLALTLRLTFDAGIQGLCVNVHNLEPADKLIFNFFFVTKKGIQMAFLTNSEIWI